MKFLLHGFLFGALACLAASGSANAAVSRSISFSTWLLDDEMVTARVTLPAAEAAALVGKDMPLLSTEGLAKYVLEHVSVSKGATLCAPTDQGYDIGKVSSLSLGPNLYGFEMIFRCSSGGPIALHNGLLFAEVARHVDFARIERGGRQATQLFTAGRQTVLIAAGGALPLAGFTRFLALGAGHLWNNLPLLCAIFGFFLLARPRGQLLTVIASLAVGYALSLLLTAAGLLADVSLLELSFGFVLACTAAVMAARWARRPLTPGTPAAFVVGASLLTLSSIAALLHRPAEALLLFGFAMLGAAVLAESSLPLWVLPGLCGLLDGWVLPGDYERLRQSAQLSLGNAAAFDGGALLMQSLLLVALMAIAAFVGARTLGQRTRLEPLLAVADDFAASLFAGLGSFWLLSRLY